MHILLLGGSGFIGSAVRARLLAEGHRVTAVARGGGVETPGVRWLTLDIAQARAEADWRPHLAGIDAVVNCAGVLQDSPTDSTLGVHVDGVAALYRACEAAGVRRVVHLSAIGADRESRTPFSATKKAGEGVLMARDLDWVILRPSVVVGRAAFGGSALVRGLAALPAQVDMPDAGELQIVQLDDLVRSVLFFLAADAPARCAMDVAGPERLALGEVVAKYRHWLGFGRARRLRMPRWLAGLLYKLGDVAGALGWPTPVRSNAQQEFIRGAVGDPGPWTRLTGIQPQALDDALAAEPASAQERWFANLYVLKPVIVVVTALFWIATGIVSLGPGWRIGLGYMHEAGVGAVAEAGVIAGALTDIVIGIGILVRRTARWALLAAVAVSLFYAITGTLLLPRLWADPIGPMMKIWPVLVLNVVALAILENRR